ncbi:MAG: SLC13 family permease [Planctomycetes bacterium]|nr:SLC13 family permease [Planctomycetota bacterium]
MDFSATFAPVLLASTAPAAGASTGVQMAVSGVLAGVIVLFMTELVVPAIVAMLIPVSLTVLGVLRPEEALRGFSNPAVVTIAAMMVLGRAINHTGALAVVGRNLAALAGRNERSFLTVTLIATVLFSAFVFNAGVVVVLLPILAGVSRETGRPPSRFLLPVAYASVLGGTCSRLGSSTNVLVSEYAEELSGTSLGMFEMTPVAVPLCVVGVLFLVFFSRRLLPDRATVGFALRHMLNREYLTELVVQEDSPIVDRRIRQTLLRQYPRLILLEILRDEAIIVESLSEQRIQPGDILLLKGDAQEIGAAMQALNLRIAPNRDPAAEGLTRQAVLAEVVIPHGSEAIGRTLRKAAFRRKLGMTVLAVKRKGVHQRHNIGELHLKAADTLLAYGDPGSIEHLKASNDYLLLERPHQIELHKRAPVALFLLLAFLVLATFNVAHISILAVATAMSAVLTGCLDFDDAFKAIDWSVLLLVGGTMALGLAMKNTDTAMLYATFLTGLVGADSPVLVVAVILVLSAALTNIMSYNATAILMMPIAYSTAVAAGLEPKPLFLAVLFGVAISFATPVGHSVNSLVYGPGGYRFSDYLRIGLPLGVLCLVTVLGILALLFL